MNRDFIILQKTEFVIAKSNCCTGLTRPSHRSAGFGDVIGWLILKKD